MSRMRYWTNDTVFAAALWYAFGDEALTEIKVDPSIRSRRKSFRLQVPESDAMGYHSEFMRGEFAVSDLRAYMRVYSDLIQILKEMDRRGDDVWVSPSMSSHEADGDPGSPDAGEPGTESVL